MGVLNLLHELMHSFGAKHDPEQTENPKCTPEDKVTSIYKFSYLGALFIQIKDHPQC